MIQSTHKTMSALTQAAMLHVKGQGVDRSRISRALQLLQVGLSGFAVCANCKPQTARPKRRPNRSRTQHTRLKGANVDRIFTQQSWTFIRETVQLLGYLVRIPTEVALS